MRSIFSIVVLTSLIIAYTKTSFLQKIELRILNLSDIHLDLHYNSKGGQKDMCRDPNVQAQFQAPYGRASCDSPQSLFEQTLSHAKVVFQNQFNQPPQYVFINGDVVGHQIASKYGFEDVKKHIVEIVQRIAYYFPDSIQLHTIGNNDLEYHYQVPKAANKKEYYQFLYELWFGKNSPSLKNRGLLSDEQRQLFLLTGFYEVQIQQNLKFMSINSIYYSVKNDQNNDPVGAQLQLQSITQALQKQDRNKFLLGFHIPPGKDLLDNDLWVPQMAQKLLQIQNLYQKKIIANLVAHLHCNMLRGSGEIVNSYQIITPAPFLFSGSVTPIFKNNPSFRVYEIESRKAKSMFQIKRYTDHVFSLSELNNQIRNSSFNHQMIQKHWSVYFDTQQFGLNQLKGRVIKDFWISTLSDNDQFIAELLRENSEFNQNKEKVIDNSKTWMNIKIPTSLSENWDLYCISLFLTEDGYKKCLQNKP